MTFKTGDKGQRYEVRCINNNGHEIVVGWANDPENYVRAVNLHPTHHNPKVIDRKAKKEG